jgi:hypothetical protein
MERTIKHDPKDGTILAARNAHQPNDGIVKSNEITVTVVPE